MEIIPGYDAWKTRGPPEPPSCACGGYLDEDSYCEECGIHVMTEEDVKDAKGDHDYEAQRDEEL